MANYDLNSNGYKLSFPGPDTVEEYDQKGGRAGACLEDACSNTGYRATLPEWASKFAPKLADLTGIARGVDTEATEKAKKRAKDPANVKSVPEKFKAYNTRVRDEWAGEDEAKLKQLQDLAQEVADGTPIDPSPSARVSAVDKAYISKAEDILSHDEDYVEARVAKMAQLVPGFTLQRDEDDRPEKTSLARLVARWIEAKLEE
jgi:hypothetical protein